MRALLGCGLAVLCACPPAAVEIAHQRREADYSKFWPASACNNCHERIYTQYKFSNHAGAFDDPMFQAQYYGQILPAAEHDERLRQDAAACLACHSPIVSLQHQGQAVPAQAVEPGLSGVTCDFCHTVRGFVGDTPGNGNYVSEPGEMKLGPFKEDTDWHHSYSRLQTQSEFCAICHSATNSHGLAVRSTYAEWKASSYATKGVQCQDCHMNSKGFLVEGEAVFQSGQAAQMTVGSAPVRSKLFSHRFPGAHSAIQLTGAITIQVAPHPAPLSPGERLKIGVEVRNTNVGHKMPSGSPELRVAYLEVRAGVSDEEATELLRAAPRDPAQPLDVAGASADDARVLGADVPAGCRLYRAVFVDQRGAQTLLNYDARALAFDSRLGTEETRREEYDYTVPKNWPAGEDVHVVATLRYLRFPSSFATAMGVAPAEAAVLSVGRGLVGGTPDTDERVTEPSPGRR